MGADGMIAVTLEGHWAARTPPVKVINTVGAGDAFVGALCAEIAQGADIQHAAQIASIAGALATTVRGAVPSLPQRAAVMSLYAD